SCSFGALDSASASLTTAPFVSMTAQAFSPPTLEPRGASASADVTYSFQVIGRNVGDIVPLLIATSLTTLSTEADSAHLYAFAGLTVHTNTIGTATLTTVCTDGSCSTSATSFSRMLNTRARSRDVGDFLFLQIAAAASGTARLFAESASA